MTLEMSRIAMLAAAAVLPAATSSALVVVGGSIDHAEPLWFGWYRSGTGVAVGTHGVITAAHVGGGPGSTFEMHGESYEVVSRQVIGDDIALLTVDRELPGFHRIADGGVSAGAEIVVAGTGRWADAPGPWGDRQDAVGRNILNSAGAYMAFSFNPVEIGEAQFTTGDSGAGVFVLGESGEYELIAIGRSIFGQPGQSTEGDLSIATSVLSFAGQIDESGSFVPGAAAIAVMAPVALFGTRRRRA